MKILRYNISFIGKLIGAIHANRTSKSQAKDSEKFGKIAEQNRPEQEDYEQRKFFNDLERRRLGYFTGSAFSSQRNQIDQMTSGLKDAAMRMGSGGGSDMASLMKGARVAGDTYNQLLGQQEQQNIQRTVLSQELLGDIAQRKLDLDTLNYLENRGESQRLKEASVKNKSAAMAGFGSFADGIFETALMGATGGFSGLLGGGSNKSVPAQQAPSANIASGMFSVPSASEGITNNLTMYNALPVPDVVGNGMSLAQKLGAYKTI